MFRYFKRLTAIFMIVTAVATAADARPEREGGEIQSVENLAIVMLIDISGSMKYTDPGRLRETAASLFIDLLSPEDHLSVITFDHNARVVISLQAVGSISNKTLIKDTMGSGLDPGGYTDYMAALQAAYEQLDTVGSESFHPVVIFLTDGEPNPDKGFQNDRASREAYLESMWETVNRFTMSGRPVYSIAFSDEVDPAVIERISLLTKGDHYILSTPLELLVSFYELLETLKNRQRTVEGSFTLEGASRGFSIPIRRDSSQVTLIIENLEGRDFSVSLNPPPGTKSEDGNPSVFKGPGYRLVVFHEPGEALEGEWEAVVTGRGSFRTLGNADNRIKVWIVEPGQGTMHPLGEPFEFKVLVTGIEDGLELPEDVLMHLTGPEQALPEPVTLTGAGGYYTGTYTGVDRPGQYDLTVTVLLGGEPVAETSSKVLVKILPVLAVDFHLKECYRTGEEMALAASLLLGGHRLTGGSELVIDHFNLVLSYTGGTRVAVPLYDAGGDSEQGEQLFSSGFWLNKYIFEWEGEAEAALLAVGSYRGEEFLLEKKLGQTTVRNPGEISLTLGDADLYTAPGRILYIPVTVENRSSFDELLLIDLTGDDSFSVLDHELRLAPDETRHFRLAIAVNSLLETGPGVLQLTFQAGNSLTAVEPVSLRLPVEILPRPAYLGRLLLDPTALPTALKVLLLCGLLVYGGGLLLYRLLVYSREKLGELVYWKEGSGDGPPACSEKIKLSRASGKKAVISFSPAGKADFNITGGSCGYDLVFEVELPGIRPWPLFLKGWQALLQKPLPPEKVVKSTPPGVIEVGGGIFTRKRLFNGDEFQSGGYSFKYLDSFTKRPVQKGDGFDVLEGKG